MAMCPECWNSKPFFAGRCTSCNSTIGFIRQTVFQTVYAFTAIGGFALLAWIVYVGIRG